MDSFWDYVIIGGGIAGFKAAEAIRKNQDAARILMVNNEDRYPYKRTKISKYLAKGFAINAFILAEADWYREQRIQIIQDTALSLETTKKRVNLNRAGRINYDKLILCMGSEPLLPELKGNARHDFLTLRTAADAGLINRKISQGDRVIISGGGVEGIEIAAQASMMGCQVTLVHNNTHLVNRHFDRTFSEMINKLLAKHGIQTVVNEQLVSIKSTGSKQKIVQIGDLIHSLTDHVIVSAGTSPRTELAMEAGIKTGNGIIVNEFMETSATDVFAAGDVAEHPDGFTSGLWHAAEKQGEVAGHNASGKKTLYPNKRFRLKLEVFDQYFFSLNKPENEFAYEAVSIQKDENKVYKAFFRNGKLHGLLMANDPSMAKTCERAVYEGWDKQHLNNALLNQ
jgi:NAD(P)H-nitrite reductase large subunit